MTVRDDRKHAKLELMKYPSLIAVGNNSGNGYRHCKCIGRCPVTKQPIIETEDKQHFVHFGILLPDDDAICEILNNMTPDEQWKWASSIALVIACRNQISE